MVDNGQLGVAVGLWLIRHVAERLLCCIIELDRVGNMELAAPPWCRACLIMAPPRFPDQPDEPAYTGAEATGFVRPLRIISAMRAARAGVCRAQSELSMPCAAAT